jgi:hypothetical protein
MELNASMVLPPVVKFEGVDSAVSVHRLATFTGTRFFRSCALNLHSNNPATHVPISPFLCASGSHSANSIVSGTNSIEAATAASYLRVGPARTAAEVFSRLHSAEEDENLSAQQAPFLVSAPTMPSSGSHDDGSKGAHVM